MLRGLRKAWILPGELSPLAESLAVPAIAAAGAGLGFRAVARFRNEALPLPACHRSTGDVVVAADPDIPLAFVRRPTGFVGGRPLGELPCRDEHQIHRRAAAEIELQDRVRGDRHACEQENAGGKQGRFHRGRSCKPGDGGRLQVGGGFHARVVHARFIKLALSFSVSAAGVAPKKRLNSRLNWEALS